MLYAAAIAGLVLALAVAWRWARDSERRRSQAFAAGGRALGFDFAEKADESVGAALAMFGDQDLIRDHGANLLTADRDGLVLRLFDWRRVRSYGNTVRVDSCSALLWRERRDGLPDFSIQPKSLRYRLDRQKSDEDVERMWPRRFSRHCFIDSEDPQGLARFLAPEAFAFFLDRHGASLFYRSGWFLFFQRNVHIQPSQIESFIALGRRAAQSVKPLSEP